MQVGHKALIHGTELPQTTRTSSNDSQLIYLNPLNAQLNPICHLLTLLGVHHILHVSRIWVKLCYSELQYHVVSNCPLKMEVTDSSEPMVTIYDCIQCHEKETIQIFTATKISKFPTQKH